MENQDIKPRDDDVEEIPDDFQCCVCLELFYKPVVLACGHIACFWCVFKAMDLSQESRCMVCRHGYSHFPRVCKLMHYLLVKLYPLAYKRRERQVSEEEEKRGCVSPQLENYSTESQEFKGFACESTTNSHPMDKTPNSVMTSGDGELSSASISPTIKIETTSNGAVQETFAKKGGEVASKPLLASDIACSLCKQLLLQPVVLNCGDVFCEPCIKNTGTMVPKCPTCDSAHPCGFPNVCLVLEHFIEELFPEEYKARKQSVPQRVDSPKEKESTCSQDQKGAGSSVSTNHYASWLSGQGPTVHLGVGCDYCGMTPIVGERYRCTDCEEKIGFDLCGQCHRGPAKLPGRFNQQHKEDHKMKLMEIPSFSEIIRRHEAESFDDDSSINDEEEEAIIAELFPNEAVTIEFVSDQDRSPSSNPASEHNQERRT